jgi:hypothetical protein
MRKKPPGGNVLSYGGYFMRKKGYLMRREKANKIKALTLNTHNALFAQAR